MNNTLLKVTPINDLLKYSFFVPDYQRGYRWEERQVRELLDDIWEFSKNAVGKEEFYCLQPLVVKKREEANCWDVIDGQQRLTTIYLILKKLNDILSILEKNMFSIRYETRSDSAEFLENIDFAKKEKNVDYFHICNAYSVISDWFAERDGTTKLNFLTTLLNNEETGKNVKVIWFEVSDDIKPVEIFTRINMGKIPLTNSELIKALFLRKGNFNYPEGDRIRMKQIQISSEWDKIENTLQNDSFWYFIHDGKKDYDTRIEYIFDLMKKKNINHDEHYTFHKFNTDLETDKNIDRLWLSIKKYFQTFEEWFNDRTLYHLIGFLVTTGHPIERLVAESINLTKNNLKKYLKEQIKIRITNPIGELNQIEFLSYDTQTEIGTIKNLLLLFNIQTLLMNNNSNIRFPFDLYKKDNWDIEHIRSINSDPPNLMKDQKNWLKMWQNYFLGINQTDADKSKSNEILNEDQELEERIRGVLSNNDFNKEEFYQLFKDIHKHFREDNVPNNIHSISNLAILNESTNRGYKNAAFPIKRRTIINKDMSGTFIPICTKNVFLKLYSNRLDNLMYWQENDARDYLISIKEALSEYFN